MSTGPFLQNFATAGFGLLISLLAILGVLQAVYFVVSGGLKGTRFYYQSRIQDENPAVRAQVIRALAERGDAVALRLLLQALSDPEPSNRLGAIEGLKRFSEKEVQDALLPMADDPHPIVRRAAINALGRYQTPQSIEVLVKALGDSYSGAQIAAIQGLKVAQVPGTIEALAGTLTSQDREVVRHAQEALLPFGIPVIDRLGAMLPEVGAAAPTFIRVMTQQDKELAYQAIAQALPHMTHTQAISEALTTLVRGQHPGMIALLTQLLEIPDYPAYELVINSFIRLHDPEAVAPLCRHLINPVLRPLVGVALESMAPVFGREMLAPLGEALRDRDLEVRRTACRLLGRIGGTLMVEFGLLVLWEEEAAEHRTFLERSLGHSLNRLTTYHEAALAMDKLMTSSGGGEGLRALDELESLLILLYADSLRGITTNETTQLILKNRRTLYPMRFQKLHPLSADLLAFVSNQAEGDRFRFSTT